MVLLAGFLLALFASSCDQRRGTIGSSAALSTGAVVSAADIKGAVGVVGTYTGDAAYAVVSYDALNAYYSDFRSEIFRQGVTKWDDRFDCNHFASYFVDLAQTRFYLANFQSRTSAQTLALGTYWYRVTGKGGHAVVVAYTDRGVVWLEPQTGAIFAPTDSEKLTAFLKVF